MNSIKFDVYGKQVLILRTDRGWAVEYVSGEGKKRPADDIVIPDFVSEAEIEQYLADLCHEWASERYPNVHRIE